MDENLIPDFDDDKVAEVRGNLFNRLIQAVLNNRWSTGWGLISEKGVNGGLISLDPNVIPGSDPVPYWRGKVTLSSSSSADHTIREVDADDVIIPESSGGRVTETGRAYNERNGVPVDTLVNVFEHPPSTSGEYADYKFHIPDGLTASPDTDLTLTAVGAGDSNWDVEDQGGKDGVEFDPARVALDATTMWHYSRKTILDSSGFVVEVGAEEVDTGGGPADFSREFYIRGDAQDVPKDDHITLVTTANGNANGKDVKLNQPQAEDSTVTLSPGDGILINNGTADVVLSFDDSGRRCDAAGGAVAAGDTPVLIEHDPNFDFPGSGSGCTATYNVVTGSNGTSVTADDCSWELLFIEASHTGMIVGIEANAVADAVNDQAEVTLQANFADVNGYDGAKKQVLVNDNGTIKWVDTAECP